MASRDSTRSSRVSPMPIRMPRGEGHFGLAGSAQGRNTGGGQFVGRAVVRHALLGQAVGEALDHDAHGGRDGAQRLDLLLTS